VIGVNDGCAGGVESLVVVMGAFSALARGEASYFLTCTVLRTTYIMGKHSIPPSVEITYRCR
jgi:hypothetical protein